MLYGLCEWGRNGHDHNTSRIKGKSQRKIVAGLVMGCSSRSPLPTHVTPIESFVASYDVPGPDLYLHLLVFIFR